MGGLKGRHKDKDVQAAIERAEALGWVLEVGGSHAWGFLYCPEPSRDGCRIAVLSTPRDPWAHARRIRRDVAKCGHGRRVGDEGARS